MTATTKRPAILTKLDMDAPPEWRWSATFGEPDLDCAVGRGETEAQAIDDLEAWVGEEEDETP